eukprot:6538744-Alexandrium_andersonii.AAC.1
MPAGTGFSLPDLPRVLLHPACAVSDGFPRFAATWLHSTRLGCSSFGARHLVPDGNALLNLELPGSLAQTKLGGGGE